MIEESSNRNLLFISFNWKFNSYTSFFIFISFRIKIVYHFVLLLNI